ncbi:MAG: ADP-ribosylglycohydrolase family protein [Kouleothrix sp.]
MPLPPDYVERVYAGVPGQTDRRLLGRPFEGWSYERIRGQLGEIWYYVHTRRDMPFNTHTLVVTDDDVTGMFTFLRALSDYGCAELPSAEQIGQTWLNMASRAVRSCGGAGWADRLSTPPTCGLSVASAHRQAAPVALNGQIIAEQIGAQIFIDGWAMVAPGDPALAAIGPPGRQLSATTAWPSWRAAARRPGPRPSSSTIPAGCSTAGYRTSARTR